MKQRESEGKDAKELGLPYLHVFGKMLRDLADSTKSSLDRDDVKKYYDGMDSNHAAS